MYRVTPKKHSKSWLAPPIWKNVAHWRQRRGIVATKTLANQPEDYYEERK
jgi:hypothetical protein